MQEGSDLDCWTYHRIAVTCFLASLIKLSKMPPLASDKLTYIIICPQICLLLFSCLFTYYSEYSLRAPTSCVPPNSIFSSNSPLLLSVFWLIPLNFCHSPLGHILSAFPYSFYALSWNIMNTFICTFITLFQECMSFLQTHFKFLKARWCLSSLS